MGAQQPDVHVRFADIYRAFNARQVELLLAHMTPDVDWPNAWEGGRAVGRAAVRDYWRRQWASIDPRLQLEGVTRLPDGRVRRRARQVVRALDGSVQADSRVSHTYTLRGGLIASMEVSGAPAAAERERAGLLGLGSNVGDRRAQLQAAIDALPRAGVQVLACSSTYDTDPVGEVRDQPSFLNACARVRTSLAALALLDAVKRLERELGREDGPRHGPRAIDIDILLLGELELHDERMSLPHAELLRRRFVLIPALELDFEQRTPGGAPLADALAALPPHEGVRWAGPPLLVPVRNRAARSPSS